MASLKEVKSRIKSVESTKKITQARQMVASAQMRKAQVVSGKAIAYKSQLEEALNHFATQPENLENALTIPRRSGAIVILITSSNSGMCGAFNANMIKYFNTLPSEYPGEKLIFIPIGKKIREAVQQAGYPVEQDYDYLLEHLSSEKSIELAETLTTRYLHENIKQIDLVYYHCKTMSVQQIIRETFLPLTFQQAKADKAEADKAEKYNADYILEPSAPEIAETLIRMTLEARIYTMLADNLNAEYSARTLAMQLATDNADDMLDDLNTSYNKVRQQSITEELSDIIGSSFA